MKHKVIKQKDGTHAVRISTGKKVPMKSDPTRLAYQYIEKKGFLTKREADQWGYERCADLKNKSALKKDTLYADFIEHWFPRHCANSTQGMPLAPRTKARYWHYLLKDILPMFGGMKCRDIEAHHIDTLMLGLIKSGLSPETARHCYRVLSLSLEGALKDGYVLNNVAKQTVPPKPRKKTAEEREDQVLNIEQQERLLQASEEEAYQVGSWTKDYLFMNYSRHTMIRLGLELGLRMGEVLALKFSDIIATTEKHDGKFVYMLKVQRATDGVGGTKLPKNGNTRRIPLDHDLMKYLMDYKEWLYNQFHEQRGFTRNDWIIPNRDGSLCVSQNRSHQMKLLFNKVGVPGSFHTLRHTAITNWLANEPNIKLVSTMAGHSNVGITLDLYGHVLESNAIDSMDNLYSTMRTIKNRLNLSKD